MKTKTQKRLLIAGLFTALGLNLSVIYQGQMPIDGGNLMSSTDDPNIQGFESATDEHISVDGAKIKERTIKVRGRDNETHTVNVTAKEVYIEKAKKKAKSKTSGSLTDQLKSALDEEISEGEYERLDTSDIQQNMEKIEKDAKSIIAELGKKGKVGDNVKIEINGTTQTKKEWVDKITGMESSIEKMQDYIDTNRKAILISYDQPEGYWCDNCKPESLGFETDSSSGFLSDSWGSINSSLVPANLIGLVSDVGEIDNAMQKVLNKLSSRNDVNKKAYLQYKKEVEEIKDCKRTLDFEKVRGAKARMEACLETMEEVVEGDADFLFGFDDDEDAQEDAIAEIYSNIAPSLSTGSQKARLRKIKDVLGIFDVDANGYDVLGDYDGESLGVVSDLMVKKFNVETAEELQSAAYDFRNARYYGPENYDLINQMEGIFERNAINQYIGNKGVDRKDARLARAIGLGSVQVYCGAKTNLSPQYPSQSYDWNCRNMAAEQMNAEEILSNLGRFGSDNLGFDLGSSYAGSDFRGTGTGLSASDILDGRNVRHSLDDNTRITDNGRNGRRSSRQVVNRGNNTGRNDLPINNTRRTRRRIN